MRLFRALAVALSAFFLGSLLLTLARRFTYPFDLEWMEGGMLYHVLRLREGRPLDAPPSGDFIPFLYTPLYPTLLALFGKVVGLGYRLGRALSLFSFFGALLLGYAFVRREGGRARAATFAAMAIPLAAFAPTGAWYDLARPDSLSLGLVTAGLLVGWWGRRSHLGVTVAALLLVAAFFTKQTASPFMIALGLCLLVASPHRFPTYLGALALFGLPPLYLLQRSTQGWFWTYIFELHQKHDFYPWRAFVGSPIRLGLLIGPALLLLPWALLRRPSPGLLFAVFIGLVGAAASCLGFGTQWAFTNAFIPGVLFLSLAVGVSAGRLLSHDPPKTLPKRRPAAVYLLLVSSLLLAPGPLLSGVAKRTPPRWGLPLGESTGYDLSAFVPTEKDRQAGAALLARLSSTPGDVLIPFHPFYPHLVGKRTFLHRMGLLDVGRAGLGAPAGLAAALAEQRFSLVVMDDKIDGTLSMWPRLTSHYRLQEQIDGPRVVSGAATHPRDLMLPIGPPSSSPAVPPQLPMVDR